MVSSTLVAQWLAEGGSGAPPEAMAAGYAKMTEKPQILSEVRGTKYLLRYFDVLGCFYQSLTGAIQHNICTNLISTSTLTLQIL